jgi:hypothetical protein
MKIKIEWVEIETSRNMNKTMRTAGWYQSDSLNGFPYRFIHKSKWIEPVV